MLIVVTQVLLYDVFDGLFRLILLFLELCQIGLLLLVPLLLVFELVLFGCLLCTDLVLNANAFHLHLLCFAFIVISLLLELLQVLGL